MNMLEAVVFDWGGVVKDSAVNHYWIVNKIFEKYGVERVSLEKLKEIWVQPYMKFYNQFIPNLSLEQQKQDYIEMLQRSDCPKTQAFWGMPELIKLLKEKGAYLAILSGDPTKIVEKEIEDYGLKNVFDENNSNVHDKFKILERIIKSNNFDLKNIYFIGDTNHEIEMGQQVGIRTIGTTWGLLTEERIKKYNPDFIVHNTEELRNVLLSRI